MDLQPKSIRLNYDVWTCLNVLETMRDLLLPHQQSSIPGATELGAHEKQACEATLMQTCDKIDKLIAQVGDSAIEVEMEKAILKNLEVTTAAEETRLEVLKTAKRPSLLYRPNVVRVADGRWAAFYGSAEHADSAVVGSGWTPEEAMSDFDREWKTRVAPKKAVKKKAKK